MAMIAEDMADAIIEKVKNSTDADNSMNKFYEALCEYVEENAEVTYSWAGANPLGVPDPTTEINAKIKTTGSLKPSGASDCDSALKQLSADLNTEAAQWKIEWPSDFTLGSAFVIPSIEITASKKTEQKEAWVAVCEQIIEGIKEATPSVSGTHSSYTGTASFTKIT